MRMDEMTVDDVSIRPSRLQLPALLATIQAAGTAPPTSAQTRELMDKMATLYEGVRIGTAEMRGLSVGHHRGREARGDAVQFRDGKVGEFAIEGSMSGRRRDPRRSGALRFIWVSAFCMCWMWAAP